MNLSTMLTLVLTGFGLGVIGATAYSLRNWAGSWRWLAVAPLLYVVACVLKLVMEVRADPTSHNLWPFEMLGTLAIASALLGGLYLVRLFMQRAPHSQ